jgi:hypothetical protein
MRAYKRLQDTYSQAYVRLPNTSLDTQAAEDVWGALFETLNWLDALQFRPEAAARIEIELQDALRFVRGRVHHQFADAIEFRDDVLLPLGPTLGPADRGAVRSFLPIADWCWCDSSDLRGGGRVSSAKSRRRSGEDAYTNVLARRQVRAALDQVASVAGHLYAGLGA